VSTRSAGTATSTMRATTSSFLAPGKPIPANWRVVLWPPSAESGVSQVQNLSGVLVFVLLRLTVDIFVSVLAMIIDTWADQRYSASACWQISR
jgi:hypothetical protein